MGSRLAFCFCFCFHLPIFRQFYFALTLFRPSPILSSSVRLLSRLDITSYRIWSQSAGPQTGKSVACPTSIFLHAAQFSFRQCGRDDIDIELEDVVSMLASLIDQVSWSVPFPLFLFLYIFPFLPISASWKKSAPRVHRDCTVDNTRLNPPHLCFAN